MDKNEFKQKLDKIYDDVIRDEADTHREADDFFVEVLESLGYDLTRFKEADRWYE